MQLVAKITNYQLPITDYRLPIAIYHLPNLIMNRIRKIYEDPRLLLLVGVVGAIFFYFSWDAVTASKLFDRYDIDQYYIRSRWAIGQGVLFKDVWSDYLLLPNLLFGVFRFISENLRPLSNSFNSFSWLWVTVSWFLYLWAVRIIATKISVRSLWIWLAPAPLFFTLVRYDIYLVIATLFCLLAVRNEKYIEGACWLGLMVALKGYALFAVPAYCSFIWYRKGLPEAIKVAAICIGPFILGNLIVLGYAGMDGLKMPYAAQGDRPNIGDSTYDAIFFLLSPWTWGVSPINEVPLFPTKIAQFLQIASAFLAAGLRPKTFDELIDAFLIAILGFISFSKFYSPQFCLWIAPIACFSASHNIRLLAVAFNWVSFLWYPVVQFFAGSRIVKSTTLSFAGISIALASVAKILYKITVIVMSSVRVAMIWVSFWQLKNRQSSQESVVGNG
ncbi:MAG: hypothetical protein ACRC62_32020 [Microcoleus sp.]